MSGGELRGLEGAINTLADVMRTRIAERMADGLDGEAVVAVESLAGVLDLLHPAVRAVDYWLAGDILEDEMRAVVGKALLAIRS